MYLVLRYIEKKSLWKYSIYVAVFEFICGVSVAVMPSAFQQTLWHIAGDASHSQHLLSLGLFYFTLVLLQKLRANFDSKLLDLTIISNSIFQSLGTLSYKLQKIRHAVVQGEAQGLHLPSLYNTYINLI